MLKKFIQIDLLEALFESTKSNIRVRVVQPSVIRSLEKLLEVRYSVYV